MRSALISRATAAALPLLVAAVACGWVSQAEGFSSIAAVFILALVASSAAAGGLPAALGPQAAALFATFPARMASGFLAIAVLAFVFMAALPWSPAQSMAAAGLGLGALGVVAMRRSGIEPIPRPRSGESVVVAASLVAVTLWCQDSLVPIRLAGEEAVVDVWQDVFLHVRILGALSGADGLQSVSAVTMAGKPAPAYHYAAYITPAALVELRATTALTAFGGFLVPFGMLIAAFAAFALLGAAFGERPAVGGTLLLLLAPDAAQQGFGNALLSYHWLQAVAPGGAYGVAIAAIAWMLMFEACRSRSWKIVAAAWGVAACTVAFKAHIFVANAYLVFVFPGLFMTGMATARRIVFVTVTTAVFAAVVAVAQGVPSVPSLRLDGTGYEPYSRLLLLVQEGMLKPALHAVVDMPASLLRALAFCFVLLPLTLGLCAVAYPFLARYVASMHGAMIAAFPALVAVVYLVMSSGLAYEQHGVGQPEELLHRPFVWAYYVVCLWTGAALYMRFAAWSRKSLALSSAVAAVVLLAFAVPAHFGRDLQTLAAWMPHRDGIHLPACLVKVAWHIRDHGSRGEVVQSADNDPRAQLSALAERQAYVIELANRMGASPERDARLAELAAIRSATDDAAIAAWFLDRSITWYVAAGGPSAWPPTLERYVDYRCGAYKAYRFAPA